MANGTFSKPKPLAKMEAGHPQTPLQYPSIDGKTVPPTIILNEDNFVH